MHVPMTLVYGCLCISLAYIQGVWVRARHAHKALPGDAIAFTVYVYESVAMCVCVCVWVLACVTCMGILICFYIMNLQATFSCVLARWWF